MQGQFENPGSPVSECFEDLRGEVKSCSGGRNCTVDAGITGLVAITVLLILLLRSFFTFDVGWKRGEPTPFERF